MGYLDDIFAGGDDAKLKNSKKFVSPASSPAIASRRLVNSAGATSRATSPGAVSHQLEEVARPRRQLRRNSRSHDSLTQLSALAQIPDEKRSQSGPVVAFAAKNTDMGNTALSMPPSRAQQHAVTRGSAPRVADIVSRSAPTRYRRLGDRVGDTVCPAPKSATPPAIVPRRLLGSSAASPTTRPANLSSPAIASRRPQRPNARGMKQNRTWTKFPAEFTVISGNATLAVAASSKMGMKGVNQDACVIETDARTGAVLMAVFDGHGVKG